MKSTTTCSRPRHTSRIAAVPTLPLALTLVALSACELLPCEVNPAACDTDAYATAPDTMEGNTTEGCPYTYLGWAPCGGDAQSCGDLACVHLDGAKVCAPPCDEDGTACVVDVAFCGDPEPWVGTCRDGECVRDCAAVADCPSSDMVCAPHDGGGVSVCGWPTEPCAPPPWTPWGKCEGPEPEPGTLACAALGESEVAGTHCLVDGKTCSVAAVDCTTGETAPQTGTCVLGVCLHPCESTYCPYAGMVCDVFGGVPVCSWELD